MKDTALVHSVQGSPAVAPGRTKWFALALLCAVQFMVVLDVAIVNVALPSIQFDLGFSQENLQWVISAYALVFGGFLLLGGRLADILGRRAVFIAGLVVFSIGSLLCGLAWSEASLIGARALQGLGAAAITPSALSILTTTFSEGRERNVALGAWGAVGRLRRRRRRPPRRDPHRPALLGVDLLRERPRGHRRARARPGPPRREPGRTRAKPRLPGRRAGHLGTCPARPWRSRRAGNGSGLSTRTIGVFRRGRGPARRLRPLGAAAARSARSLLDLQACRR